jgi:hypothetical protein
MLRPGKADSNTVTDHMEVLAAAIAQVPAGSGHGCWSASTAPGPAVS